MGQLSSSPFMNIRDDYKGNKKTFSFDIQDRLDDKIDKLTSMMSKLSTQGSNQIDHLSPKFITEKGEDKIEIIIIKADTDQTVRIDTVDLHMEVDLGTDKIIEKGLSMFKSTEEILGEEISEKHKILEEAIEIT